MALAEKRICEHTDATTISSADEFIVDSMANGTRNITMTNLENQILSTDTYSALTGIGDGTITGSIADIDSNLNNLTYDSTTNRLTMTGNTAFSGTIDSSPTTGSGNAVSSGGTKTYVDSAVSQLNDEIGVIDNQLTSMNSFGIGSITGSSGTLTQQCIDFAINIKNTYGMTNAFEGMFMYTATSKPSDIPANEQVWNYASGKFLIRAVGSSNNLVDATIVLFGYGASKIAIKTVANSAQATNWVVLGS